MRSDLGSVAAAYDEARRRSRLFRLAAALLEPVYPVRAFLIQAAELFEPSIRDLGLHAGCRKILDVLPLEWACRYPSEGEELVRTAPVLLYGNHPSLLTPFLVAACVGRDDLHFCSMDYVRRLVPSMGAYCHPLELSLTRSWVEWKRGGFRRVLAFRLLSLLGSDRSPEAARETNREALRNAVADLRDGQSVMIIPGGGGKRNRVWFSGIGVLAKRLIEDPGAPRVYVVPTREENCSNRRVYAMLMRGPVARLSRRIRSRRPVRLVFGEPTPLSELVYPAFSVAEAVEALRAHYESTFPPRRPIGRLRERD